MQTLAHYQVSHLIHESFNSIIYQGYHPTTQQPVILKMLKAEYPLPEKVAQFKGEYELLRRLELPGVIKAYELLPLENRWLMALEDFGGQSLQRLALAGQLPLADLLTLAIKITACLSQIQQHHIIHKDINPSNIILNPTTQEVKLIDFGISTALSQENSTFRSPNRLEGTLVYISPEQTGRMNRAIDYRTDYYSLGVTLYELLTGQRPFESADALELIHNHMAKDPLPPTTLLPSTSPVLNHLSAIILKLMAKNPEARYQSAHGLTADLNRCLAELNHPTTISFELGQEDSSAQFQIPQKLYGRAPELTTLLTRFEQVLHGQPELMLVMGQAGIGKSALVQEVYKPITQQRGYFIAGKFDQLQRNIPYASLIQAFQTLIQHLLTENESQIATWRAKLNQALAPNGQIMTEVIPELALIIGPQPPVPTLAPAEAQNRFNLVFQNLVRCFSQPEHPLVLFLDDLQWADGASLKLLEVLLSSHDPQPLFVIAAYRDNEVTPAHPVSLTLEAMQQQGVPLTTIHLAPLQLADVSHLLADTLHCPLETLSPLDELVLQKSGGNPFFINEFLKSLYQAHLFTFNPRQRRWQWEVNQIQQYPVTANVVDLLTHKIQQLPSATQNLLQLAACLGNQFSLNALVLASNQTTPVVATQLWPTLLEGLVLPLHESYKFMQVVVEGDINPNMAYRFAHDRIQQAVYDTISPSDKPALHYRLGQLLEQQTNPDSPQIFEVVNHLNQGQSHLRTAQERIELAQLNLMAGKKAKASAAYEPAYRYLQQGLGLLTPQSWQEQYDLTLELYLEAMESAVLNAKFTEMENLADLIIKASQSDLERVKVYEIKIYAYHAQNKLVESVQIALDALDMLGIPLPRSPQPSDIGMALQEVQMALGDKPIENLLNEPQMVDPVILAAIRITTNVSSAVLGTNPFLFLILVCKQVSLLIKYGNAPDAPQAYATYGLILSGMRNIDAGYQFGQLALKLLEQSNDKKVRAKAYVFYSGICHLKKHTQEALPLLLEGYQCGLETGDFAHAAMNSQSFAVISYMSGKDLPRIKQNMAKYGHAIKQMKQDTTLQWLNINWQAVLNWEEETSNPGHLKGAIYDEDLMLPIHLQSGDNSALFYVYSQKVMLYYYFCDFYKAFEYLEKLEPYMLTVGGSWLEPPAYMYASLALLGVFDHIPPEDKQAHLDKVIANQEKMQLWASHAPMNYLHKWHLVEAEKARVLGQDSEAQNHYEQAIDLAIEHQYLNEEALAYELTGRYYMGKGQARLARYYLREAHYAYQRWGALAKVKHLEQQYPELLLLTQSRRRSDLTLSTSGTNQQTSTSSTTQSSAFDLHSVLKASQFLSGEIQLETLLTNLMRVLIENAGAELGYLLLPRGSEWLIEAEGHIGQSEVPVLQSIPFTAIQPTTDLPLVSNAIIHYVLRTKETVVLNDATREGQFTRDGYISQKQPKSILCAPLVNQGKLISLIYLENNLAYGTFTSDRLQILNMLSAQAAISIENASLYTTLQNSEAKYRTIFENSRDTIFISTPEGQILDVSPACFNLLGYTRDELLGMNTRELYLNPMERDEFQQAIELYGSVKDYEGQLQHKSQRVVDALLTASIWRALDGTVLGYQGIIRDITQRKQAEREKLRLTAIERELNVAQNIQLSLLAAPNPKWRHLQVACYNTPAREVGGDLYAYHAFENESKYALIVGDVSGKGMPAALLMAVSLSSIQSVVGQDFTPAKLLAYLDKAIMPYTKKNQNNCAVCYAEITPPTAAAPEGELVVVNAGCIPPYIKRPGQAVEQPEIGGFALGQGLGSMLGYQQFAFPLSPQDMIVMVSDGVVEANNQANDMLGFEHLSQLIADGPATSAEAMLSYLKEQLDLFTQGAEQHDDITIIVAKI